MWVKSSIEKEAQKATSTLALATAVQNDNLRFLDSALRQNLNFKQINYRLDSQTFGQYSEIEILTGLGPITQEIIKHSQLARLVRLHGEEECATTDPASEAEVNHKEQEKMLRIMKKSNYGDGTLGENFTARPMFEAMKSPWFPEESCEFKAPNGFTYEATLTEAKNNLLVSAKDFKEGSRSPYFFDNSNLYYYHDIEQLACCLRIVINTETKEVLKSFENELVRIYKEDVYRPLLGGLSSEETKKAFANEDLFEMSEDELCTKTINLFEKLISKNDAFFIQDNCLLAAFSLCDVDFTVEASYGEMKSITLTTTGSYRPIKVLFENEPLKEFFSILQNAKSPSLIREVIGGTSYRQNLTGKENDSVENFGMRMSTLIQRFLILRTIAYICEEIEAYQKPTLEYLG